MVTDLRKIENIDEFTVLVKLRNQLFKADHFHLMRHVILQIIQSYNPRFLTILQQAPYPIAFSHTGNELWHQYDLNKITGLQDKNIYRAFCFSQRFSFFAEKVKEYNPKLIIGTGSSYLIDFLTCFAGDGGIDGMLKMEKINPSPQSKNKHPRTYYWAKINGGKTTLVVVPFFSGSRGLNSNYLLQKIGESIAKIVPELSENNKL
ncbi:MAG: hypothetical protein KAJ86_05440 [Alphaproteobacteria bacterium]|nr:hypothetical protein [Alphaproteobacteria bacterium]